MLSVVLAQKVVQGDEADLDVYHRLILEECSLYAGMVISFKQPQIMKVLPAKGNINFNDATETWKLWKS